MSEVDPISELIKQRNEAETEIERLQSLNAELMAANAKLKDALQDAVYEIQKLETEMSDE